MSSDVVPKESSPTQNRSLAGLDYSSTKKESGDLATSNYTLANQRAVFSQEGRNRDAKLNDPNASMTQGNAGRSSTRDGTSDNIFSESIVE